MFGLSALHIRRHRHPFHPALRRELGSGLGMVTMHRIYAGFFTCDPPWLEGQVNTRARVQGSRVCMRRTAYACRKLTRLCPSLSRAPPRLGHEGWQTQIQRYTPTLKLHPRRPLSRRPDYTLRSPCFCAYPHTGVSHSV